MPGGQYDVGRMEVAFEQVMVSHFRILKVKQNVWGAEIVSFDTSGTTNAVAEVNAQCLCSNIRNLGIAYWSDAAA